MNRITHSLVGYDRVSEYVAEEFDVADAFLPKAKELAGVPLDDPEAMMCYPLDTDAARKLADILKAKIDPSRCDYVLEGFSYEFADDAEFRPDGLGWSVWIHDDAAKIHIKITIARRTLDDYASNHCHKDHRAVINMLNAQMNDQVRKMINRAVDDGRASGQQLELNEHDLGVLFDGIGV